MRVAIPVWNENISPVLDTSSELRLFTVEQGGCAETGPISLDGAGYGMAERIAANTEVLICGALSGCLEQDLRAHGVTVHPWVMGDVSQVIEAFANGGIKDYEYSMPGCRRRFRGGCRGGGYGRRGR